ncbi:hypothetical protein EVAR_59608_1 [Eumeta japonica]|uniref:Uncharacterized protein n=1 Tax=Eumeta variegata TaxID=151549 RepID=A0A4C1Z7V3_EUMVA|nr:hypothetical protein EVAR_59608_1 [Eumeta japonica]
MERPHRDVLDVDDPGLSTAQFPYALTNGNPVFIAPSLRKHFSRYNVPDDPVGQTIDIGHEIFIMSRGQNIESHNGRIRPAGQLLPYDD